MKVALLKFLWWVKYCWILSHRNFDYLQLYHSAFSGKKLAHLLPAHYLHKLSSEYELLWSLNLNHSAAFNLNLLPCLTSNLRFQNLEALSHVWAPGAGPYFNSFCHYFLGNWVLSKVLHGSTDSTSQPLRIGTFPTSCTWPPLSFKPVCFPLCVFISPAVQQCRVHQSRVCMWVAASMFPMGGLLYFVPGRTCGISEVGVAVMLRAPVNNNSCLGMNKWSTAFSSKADLKYLTLQLNCSTFWCNFRKLKC